MKYTLEQLEGMSDDDLNKVITELTDVDLLKSESYYWDDTQNVFWPNCAGAVFVKDYCNSWADMGPLIQELIIDIEWPDPDLGYFGQASKYMQGIEDIFVGFKRKEEALRAAAIAYILAKQEEY